jgi:hypothetical protein
MALVVRVLAVEGIHTGRLKTIWASVIAGRSRAREAWRRSVLLEAIRCVCLEEVVIGRLRRWVVSARGRM